MNLHGKDVQVGHGINSAGFLQTAVLALWNVQTYQEIWGTFGKAVDKVRSAIIQNSKKEKVRLSITSLQAALRQRKHDMKKYAAKRTCKGTCAQKCIYCTKRDEHVRMETMIRESMQAIEGLL